jgi:hypothetical protein
LVESGEKRQTIRAVGKRRHARLGDLLQLYTGLRTAFCRKLVNPNPVCVAVHSVYIFKISALRGEGDKYQMYIDERIVFHHEVTEIAVADAFPDKTEFCDFFDSCHGMPFHGVMIR